MAVFLFSFLSRSHGKINNEVEAASLANFDPGYIISDYQMGNYNSMSEAEIQAFLTAKNSCANDDYSYYRQLTANNPGVNWHFEDGHFICLSEEKFGDGEEIGSGDTAAHIIWEAAQDYQINPQVLIVLLQKETGLITDPIPNNYDYRKATGYGCPDTAACSSKYYGFKNQIRNAAALFSTVLNGGWTNYPLGENYIQYNPNAGCGGSIVNVRSLATSALYRYTPYQPNEGTLAAGYGTAYCGAYGNRNFYLYFEDWFGGITQKNGYSDVKTPRYMMVNEDTYFVESYSGEQVDFVDGGTILKFTSKILNNNGDWCIRTEEDTKNDVDKCILRKDLSEAPYSAVDIPRYMIVKDDTNYISPRTLSKLNLVKKDTVLKFTTKVLNNNGEWCIRTEEDTKNDVDKCILRKDLSELPYSAVDVPRYMIVISNINYILPRSLIKLDAVEEGTVLKFTSKILNSNGEWCIRTEEDTKNDVDRCIVREELDNTQNYIPSNKPRQMKVIGDSYYIVPHSLVKLDAVEEGTVLKFASKILDGNGEWCIRTEEDTDLDKNLCIPRSKLTDI
ncbi:hypothetical protein IJH24_02545 [Candidatus Saccharibacteria bacterium]|nr:hypothetical protein [Candidatus Saccharibacteria bacterium]